MDQVKTLFGSLTSQQGHIKDMRFYITHFLHISTLFNISYTSSNSIIDVYFEKDHWWAE